MLETRFLEEADVCEPCLICGWIQLYSCDKENMRLMSYSFLDIFRNFHQLGQVDGAQHMQ